MATLACPQTQCLFNRAFGKQVVYARQPRHGLCLAFRPIAEVRVQLLQSWEGRRNRKNLGVAEKPPSECGISRPSVLPPTVVKPNS
ncbi:hypothetical protein KFL_006950020 [Klebsormidium nitens]|uniref:Uncharacterized protein n=1 Tax=Klebsormidium nitens TaxID=105231 RepID=A0A1Y1IQG4_KLENI|nr:hypothetical protein KFL_006950020 [Klebsormidium nitens]|eukprot:GAQ90867.1 hypothetical protein KFL_006950020 [Klebsormidium nitens]